MTVPAPSEISWNVIVAEWSHHIRVYQQLVRDQKKKNGPKPGQWELEFVKRLLRTAADHTGLEFRG